MSSSSCERGPVELLADEFLGRCKRGEKPTIKEYCDRHPEAGRRNPRRLPVVVYQGNPEERKAERRRRLAQARHHRRERNVGLQQGTLPFATGETVAHPAHP